MHEKMRAASLRRPPETRAAFSKNAFVAIMVDEVDLYALVDRHVHIDKKLNCAILSIKAFACLAVHPPRAIASSVWIVAL
ncbi:hypothetical protein B0G74_2227 [Paraburkholderia sp. BL9I2N2]|nr:hypothetical protein B0G74_2227 [Paraburkholderia sp. BL9I2N2]